MILLIFYMNDCRTHVEVLITPKSFIARCGMLCLLLATTNNCKSDFTISRLSHFSYTNNCRCVLIFMFY